MPRLTLALLAVVAAITTLGCSRGASRVAGSAIDAHGAAKEAVAAYDKNGDGQLSKDELKLCPALLAAIDGFDTNKDQSLSADEIATKLQAWVDSRVALTNPVFYLKLDGRPLTNAEVKLEPEPFLGDAVSAASGKSDGTGRVGPSLPADKLPPGIRFGMLCGLYKVHVTHPAIKNPAKYDAQTSLGLEVPPQFNLYNPPTFELTNK